MEREVLQSKEDFRAEDCFYTHSHLFLVTNCGLAMQFYKDANSEWLRDSHTVHRCQHQTRVQLVLLRSICSVPGGSRSTRGVVALRPLLSQGRLPLQQLCLSSNPLHCLCLPSQVKSLQTTQLIKLETWELPRLLVSFAFVQLQVLSNWPRGHLWEQPSSALQGSSFCLSSLICRPGSWPPISPPSHCKSDLSKMKI